MFLHHVVWAEFKKMYKLSLPLYILFKQNRIKATDLQKLLQNNGHTSSIQGVWTDKIHRIEYLHLLKNNCSL